MSEIMKFFQKYNLKELYILCRIQNICKMGISFFVAITTWWIQIISGIGAYTKTLTSLIFVHASSMYPLLHIKPKTNFSQKWITESFIMTHSIVL